jgi:hypothetical protein
MRRLIRKLSSPHFNLLFYSGYFQTYPIKLRIKDISSRQSSISFLLFASSGVFLLTRTPYAQLGEGVSRKREWKVFYDEEVLFSGPKFATIVLVISSTLHQR